MINNQYTGIAFPPQKTGAGFFAIATEEDLIAGNIYTLLRTRKGEMYGVPDFGSSCHDLLFEPVNSATQTLLADSLRNDIKKWEPRVSIDYINIVPGESAYSITIALRLLATNKTFNYTDDLDYKER